MSGIYSEQSEQIDQIATALVKVQAELKDAVRATEGHGYTYAELSDVLKIIRAAASNHGISFVQPVMDGLNGKIVIETKLMHTSGQWMRSSVSLNALENKKMSGAQAIGAVITYGRRYTLAAVFGISQEDNDASNQRIEDVLGELQLARIQDDEEKAIGIISKLPDHWKAQLRSMLTRVESQWLVEIQKKREKPPEATELPNEPPPPVFEPVQAPVLEQETKNDSVDPIEENNEELEVYDADGFGWTVDEDQPPFDEND